MKKWILWMVASCFFLVGEVVTGQITISMANLQPINVTPSEMCRVILINQGTEKTILLEAEIRNSSNDVVLFVKSFPYLISTGINTINPQDLSFSEISYGEGQQSLYVQTRRQLPSGNYSYCVKVSVSNDNGLGDSFCDEISNLDNANLMLINPDNKEIIETKNPMLIWMHSEPFEVLSEGEAFKLILVELFEDQSAQSGISVNPPLFYVNQVLSHNILYSFDAPELVPGNRYGWQIQRISNGVVIDRTEAWEFTMKPIEIAQDLMYVTLKKELDASFYRVKDGHVYFKFQEKYLTNQFNCRIYNSSNGSHNANTTNLKYGGELNYKKNGYNEFELDVEPFHLKSGLYILEIRNGKGDVFKLKFKMD